MKIVLDTNLLASAFTSKNKDRAAPAIIYSLWLKKEIDLIVTEIIFAEYADVLYRRHIRQRHLLSDNEISQVLEDIEENSIFVVPTEDIQAVERDADDDMIIECAVAGQADYIVSGDKDLLSLGQFRDIPIVTAREFLERLEGETASTNEQL